MGKDTQLRQAQESNPIRVSVNASELLPNVIPGTYNTIRQQCQYPTFLNGKLGIVDPHSARMVLSIIKLAANENA